MSILVIWLCIAISGMFLHTRLFPDECRDTFDKVVITAIYFFASPVIHIMLMILTASKPKWNFVSILSLIIYIFLNIILCAQLLNIA
jgi:hypothetical protein